MLIKYFWMYIGSFFACGVALLFMVKNFAEGFGGSKKPVVLGSVSAVGFSGGACLATYISDHLFTVFWIFAAIFLLFGIIHLVFFHKKYFYSNNNNRGKVFWSEIIFGVAMIFFVVVAFSSLQYLLKGDKSFLFFPMLMSLLCFFIPMLIFYTFEAAFKIPAPVFTTWRYPVDSPIDLPDEKINEKLVVIAFEIPKKLDDERKTNFRAKGPETMQLGDLYYHFVNDYNEFHSETTIDYVDKYQEPIEWWFRVKPKWYQRNRILDPGLSIYDNKIKEDTIIVCERILSKENIY